ncbi:MAG: hypothetical protein LBT08_02895 [Synergistaceae bacterium]|jgi:uncharacterized protein YutE (UPF0331/DUF86 family)|nr:hypothetical protein [Synergistaceae bacterium]
MLKESHRLALWNIFDKSRQTISEIEAVLGDTQSPWRLSVCAGVGTLLGNLYMSIERILRLFIENVYGERIVKDDSWHRRLIEAGNIKGLLPQEMEPTLQGMRRFRHLLTHGYGIDMDEEELRKNIPEAIDAYLEIEKHLMRLFSELERR